MSTETDIRDDVGAILSGGCHNQVNTGVSQVLPYAVFYEVPGMLTHTIHGAVAAEERLYQVDVFAATQEQAKGLALGTVKAAIAALGGELVSPGFNGEYEEVSKTFCYITEYRFWVT